MKFNKREGYSLGKGMIYQISHDEFVSSTYSDLAVFTWMKGTKRAQLVFDSSKEFGAVGDSFFFGEDDIIKKVELINDQIAITEFVQIEDEIEFLFITWSLHYFIERNNSTFAIPVNEDYRSHYGIEFNISIEELKEYSQIHVHDDFLFCITKEDSSSTIRRYQSDSEEYLEEQELPGMFNQSVIFNNYIFYLSLEGNLISVNMTDLSYEVMKTNMEAGSHVVGINEKGMMNVQTEWDENVVHLFSAKLPQKYIVNKHKSIDSNKEETEELLKRIEELERKFEAEKKNSSQRIVENEQKNWNEEEEEEEDEEEDEEDEDEDEEDEEKAELEKQNAVMQEEMKDLKSKYNRLLLRVSTWDSDHSSEQTARL